MAEATMTGSEWNWWENIRVQEEVEDYWSTHDVDDYKEFEDNEAWYDMRGEFDDYDSEE